MPFGGRRRGVLRVAAYGFTCTSVQGLIATTTSRRMEEATTRCSKVQIVHKLGPTVVWIEHIGSAHDTGQLSILLQTTPRSLHQIDNTFKRSCRLGSSSRPTRPPCLGADQAGRSGPTRVTFTLCLKRVIERDYRTVLATA
jgi:hypothetical protein